MAIFKRHQTDIFEDIREDHRIIRSYFTQALAGDTDCYTQLRELLLSHMDAEEETLYPVLEERDQTRFLSLSAEQEHHVARLLLKELDSMKRKDEHWMAKLRVLFENVDHHIQQEEDEVLRQAPQVLSEGEQHQVVAEFELERGLLS